MCCQILAVIRGCDAGGWKGVRVRGGGGARGHKDTELDIVLDEEHLP